MAGQGWREWTAGEQLTDVKMQQFLQDQAVMRFADASARTTALTGVVSEGMVTYLDDTNTVEVWDGSEWAELTGDPDIFTQGTAGNYLISQGTAGVAWTDGAASPTSRGVVFGATSDSFQEHVGYGKNSPAGTVGTFGQNPNTGIGYEAMPFLTTGHNGVAVGKNAGYANTSGARNTSIGAQALYITSSGDDNTGLGMGAGYSTNGTASQNTFVGSKAGGTAAFNTLTGSNNILLGYEAWPSSNSASNEITLGNSSITTLRCQVTSITSLSDQRDKRAVEDLCHGLDLINQLRPIEFEWNHRDGSKIGQPDIGFLAQELAAVEDKFGAHEQLQLTLRDNPNRLEATQGRLIPILVKAVQELSARIEELENDR